MSVWMEKARQLVMMKAKYATASAIATAVDYTLYLMLVDRVFSPAPSNVISYTCGVLVNFVLQRFFVFELQRRASHAFLLAMLVSLGGMAISTGIVAGLSMLAFLHSTSLLQTLRHRHCIFYNFYFKRYVFEKAFCVSY
ncbi:MAG: GtrA family protein [Saprospiraceae bacterium]|nr:GtrA family protein [Saprospiraceae bacterium]